jgi:hypothetical protein
MGRRDIERFPAGCRRVWLSRSHCRCWSSLPSGPTAANIQTVKLYYAMHVSFKIVVSGMINARWRSERTYDGFAFGGSCRPDNEWFKIANPAQEIELPRARKKPKHAIEWKKNEAVDNGTDAGGAGLGRWGSQSCEGREDESQSIAARTTAGRETCSRTFSVIRSQARPGCLIE